MTTTHDLLQRIVLGLDGVTAGPERKARIVKPLPSQAELQSLLDYDQSTGDLTWKSRPREMFASDRDYKKWNTRFAGKPAFIGVCGAGYRRGKIKGEQYSASRVIFKLIHGADTDKVDHEDGDILNNRIGNLRDASHKQNMMNRATPKHNTSGHIGVIWCGPLNKWTARIRRQGKQAYLGCFTEFEDAVAARKQAELDYGYHPNHGRRT